MWIDIFSSQFIYFIQIYLLISLTFSSSHIGHWLFQYILFLGIIKSFWNILFLILKANFKRSLGWKFFRSPNTLIISVICGFILDIQLLSIFLKCAINLNIIFTWHSAGTFYLLNLTCQTITRWGNKFIKCAFISICTIAFKIDCFPVFVGFCKI